MGSEMCIRDRHQHITYIPKPNSTSHPDHPTSYIGHYRGTLNTEPISRRQTPNHVPTTRFRTMVTTIERSIPNINTKHVSRRQTANHVRTTRFCRLAIIEQGSVPYISLDNEQQATAQLLGWVQWPLPYKDQHRTYLPTPNNKPRPDHSVTYNDQKHTTISNVPIARHPTTNHVPITLLQTTVINSTVQRSIPYASPNAQQQRSS